MGILDKVKEQAAAQQAVREASTVAAANVVSGCPGSHYVTKVNKGSIRMQTWESDLNAMYRDGYRLAHVLEQDGNTVQVFEHSFH